MSNRDSNSNSEDYNILKNYYAAPFFNFIRSCTDQETAKLNFNFEFDYNQRHKFINYYVLFWFSWKYCCRQFIKPKRLKKKKYRLIKRSIKLYCFLSLLICREHFSNLMSRIDKLFFPENKKK